MGIFNKKDKKTSTYKKLLMGFTILMIGASAVALIYVYNSLNAYEKGDIDVYMTSLMKDIKKSVRTGNLAEYFEITELKNSYEKTPSLEKGYQELINNNTLTYKKAKEKNTYDILAGDKVILTVLLDDSKTETRLGLLTYTDYEIKDTKTYHENGLYELDFYLADNYQLYINDTLVSKKDLIEESQIKEFSEVYSLVKLPTLNHYHIDNLTYEPEITIKDLNNKEVKYTKEGSNYYANTFFETDDETLAMEKLNNKYEPLEFAKNWSLFLTDDLKGTRHGLYKLTPNLIEGTEIYQRAYNWATNVDITFTSNHYLPKEIFTNTKVSNYTIYNENAFSVEVYLEKNMVLSSGKKRQDVLHDVLYFIYYDGAYRLVHMKSVTD